ncbi:hypothetical protein K438DRAFT_1782230 [Mycena galopus ATCC 62051]|nr:hypothetical protein K438DRAFT_1782230 [Mycena galopus ATCC 62051]
MARRPGEGGMNEWNVDGARRLSCLACGTCLERREGEGRTRFGTDPDGATRRSGSRTFIGRAGDASQKKRIRVQNVPVTKREAAADVNEGPEQSESGLWYCGIGSSLVVCSARPPGGNETGPKEERLNGRTDITPSQRDTPASSRIDGVQDPDDVYEERGDNGQRGCGTKARSEVGKTMRHANTSEWKDSGKK